MINALTAGRKTDMTINALIPGEIRQFFFSPDTGRLPPLNILGRISRQMMINIRMRISLILANGKPFR